MARARRAWKDNGARCRDPAPKSIDLGTECGPRFARATTSAVGGFPLQPTLASASALSALLSNWSSWGVGAHQTGRGTVSVFVRPSPWWLVRSVLAFACRRLTADLTAAASRRSSTSPKWCSCPVSRLRGLPGKRWSLWAVRWRVDWCHLTIANRTFGPHYLADSQAELTPAWLMWEQATWLSISSK